MLATAPSASTDIRARIVTHLMRGVVHDVNNSLTAIGLAAELAQRKQDAQATAVALERAVSVSQAQRRLLDAAVLLLSDPGGEETPSALPLGHMLADLANLCSSICGHRIAVDDQSNQGTVEGRSADLALLITACLLDARLTEGDLTVTLSPDPQDDQRMRLTLSGTGLGPGGLFEVDDLPTSGLEALAVSAGCTLIWQDQGGLAGLSFTR